MQSCLNCELSMHVKNAQIGNAINSEWNFVQSRVKSPPGKALLDNTWECGTFMMKNCLKYLTRCLSASTWRFHSDPIEILTNNDQIALLLPTRYHSIRDYGFIIIIIADSTGTDNNGTIADQIIAFRLSKLPERRRVRRIDAKAIPFGRSWSR